MTVIDALNNDVAALASQVATLDKQVSVKTLNRRDLLKTSAALAATTVLLQRDAKAAGGLLFGTPQTNSYNDGFNNAPVGAAQYPTLLNGLTIRPPWHVAGVDYAVGPNGTPILDPTTSPPAGTSYAANLLTVTQDNVTIDGYDFSLHSGVAISCPSNNNLTIQNCKFGGSNYPALSTGPIDFRGSGLTLKYNTIDGGSVGGAANQSTLLFIYAGVGGNSGTVVLQYNWFKNYCQQIIELLTSATLDYRYNLVDDTTIETSGHMNWLQWSDGTATAPVVQFNTSRQTTVGGAEGFQFYFNGSGTMNSPDCSYNTLSALNSGVMSYIIHGSGLGTGTTNLTGSPVSHDNYFNFTGALGAFYPGSFGGWVLSNNWNMVTGAALPNNP